MNDGEFLMNRSKTKCFTVCVEQETKVEHSCFGTINPRVNLSSIFSQHNCSAGAINFWIFVCVY